MFKNKFNYHLINWLALLALLYIAFSNINLWLGILGKVIQVMAPFIIAFAFAYALTPFVEFLQRRGLSQKLAVTITILGTVIIIVGLVIKENYRKSEFNNHYLAYKEQAEQAQKIRPWLFAMGG